jgi:NAD(P)-dependent dehydrogenase (short-subunit alcohol dehydrogenase family)
MKLKGRRAIITGANQGFGLAVAKAFVTEGADVMLCARNGELLSQAQKELKKLNSQVKILTQVTDVSKAADVNTLIQKSVTELGGMDILIANAGIYGPKGAIEENNWEEWSQAIDINLKGVVMLCQAVTPHFKQKKYGKIVLLSGGGATKPMPFMSAYAASKAAVVRFGETLAEEVKDFNIDVNSIAPGALNTRLLDEVLAAGPEKVGNTFYQQSIKQKEQGGAPLEKGAELCVYLASNKSDGITGKLISAVWDPWQSFDQYRDDLKNSDIYTLRRIVPKDRGKNWGDV